MYMFWSKSKEMYFPLLLRDGKTKKPHFITHLCKIFFEQAKREWKKSTHSENQNRPNLNNSPTYANIIVKDQWFDEICLPAHKWLVINSC